MRIALRLFVATVTVQIVALLMSLVASVGIAFGFHPESFLIVDWFAPCAALFVVAWWLGRKSGWKAGAALGLVSVVLWLATHWFLATRFMGEFWHDGLAQLSLQHGLWWVLALVLTSVGAALGHRFVSFRSAALVSTLPIFLLVGLQWVDSKRGAVIVEADGTTVRVAQFDLKRVDIGLYDADFDDSQPLNDRNATWLGQPIGRVWNKVQLSQAKPLLCLVNGGFFGAETPWVGLHEAPMMHAKKAHYNATLLERDWPQQYALLTWKQEGESLQPHIVRRVAFNELAKNYEGALGGVRVLIENGKSGNLKPGMGGTTLRCSRTSIGWDENTLYVLSVRDPDGEASSLRGNKFEKSTGQKVQVGGWDVAQVQQFWRDRNIKNAVLFDGGESTQIKLAPHLGGETVHSSYHFTRSLGFIHKRPLRMVLPMLPPSQANGGVLNWFYIAEK